MGKTSITQDALAVIVRYVFLVPPNAMGGWLESLLGRRSPATTGTVSVPARKQIEQQMANNMRELDARIEKGK